MAPDLIRPLQARPGLYEAPPCRRTRVVAVACMLGACIVTVVGLQIGVSSTSPRAASELVVLEGGDAVLNGFAELSPKTRKAQLQQMLTSAERFSRQMDGATRTQLAPSSKLCEKKDLIIGKFDQLLAKLTKDDSRLNITDEMTEKEYDDAMQAWLDTESVYRLAVQTHKESKEAASYALKKLAVEMKVHKLTKERVAEVVKKYPIKKAEIDGERNLILELIKLVEELAGDGSEDDSAAQKMGPKSTLSAIQAKLTELGKAAEGPNGSKKLQEGLKVVEAKMMASYHASARLGKHRSTQLQASPEEMEATKNEVKKVLLELLQDPDFRSFMLKMGMMDLLATLTQEKNVLQEDQQMVADLTDKSDQSAHREKDSGLKRGPAAGLKTTKEEEYEDEHEAFLKTSKSLLREIWIIRQIKKKIISYCTTGTWEKSDADSVR